MSRKPTNMSCKPRARRPQGRLRPAREGHRVFVGRAMRATMGTSHEGDHVFVGNYGSYVHAYDARSGENPSVQFWVR